MTAQHRQTPVWALVPVKSPGLAKTRLAGVLSPEFRAALQRAMLKDVLAGLLKARRLTGVAVVSADPAVGTIALGQGAIFIAEYPATGDLNDAATLGARRLANAGADIIAVVHADLPLLDPDDIDRAVDEAMRTDAAVVVPDRRGDGTNAIVFHRDRWPRFSFGAGSLGRHLEGRAVCLPLPSLALDVDVPEDIAALMAAEAPGARETRALLAKNVAEGKDRVYEEVH